MTIHLGLFHEYYEWIAVLDPAGHTHVEISNGFLGV